MYSFITTFLTTCPPIFTSRSIIILHSPIVCPIECFHVTSWSHEEVHVILLVYRLIAESVLDSDTHANCTPDLSLIDLCCNVVTCYNYVRRKHSWLCSFWLPRRDGGHVQKCCGVMQNDVIFHHMIKTFCTHKWAADQNNAISDTLWSPCVEDFNCISVLSFHWQISNGHQWCHNFRGIFFPE